MTARLPKPAKWLTGWRRWRVLSRQVRPLLSGIAPNAKILEIGGGYNPRFLKSDYPQIHHLDHCSADELRQKYAADPVVAHLIGRIQEVDLVFNGAPIDELVPASLRFDVVYGSHVLEHQVDLIGHLQSLERLLAPGGRVIEIIPDFRCCFDALRYPSLCSDALMVHWRPSPVHRAKQVFDAESRGVDCNPGRVLRGPELAAMRFKQSLQQAYEATLAADHAQASYRDLHAWTFCPESFRLLLVELRLLGLSSLHATMVTPTYGNQFCAVLEKAETTGAALRPEQLQALEAERLALTRLLRF